MKISLLFCLLFACSSQGWSQPLYYVRQDFINGQYFLSTYDPEACLYTDVSPIDLSGFVSPFVLDLAVTPTGDFYLLIASFDTTLGALFDPYLVKFELATNSTSIATPLPFLCNSLVSDVNNVLYAAGEGLFSYNTNTAAGQDLGTLNFIPSGDLMILDGGLFCASAFPNNRLMEINTNAPSQSTVFAQFVLPPNFTVWGIAAIQTSCDSTSIYFAAATGINFTGTSSVYEYDLTDHNVSFLCSAPDQITGFTSPEEFNSFNCAIRLDLDADGSSGAPPTDWQAPPLCSGNLLPVTDADATYYSGYHTDSIRLRLLPPTPDAAFEYLTAAPSGTASVAGQGTRWLTLFASSGFSVSVANADYETALRTVRWHDDVVPPTPGVRSVEVIAFDSEGQRDTSYAYLTMPLLPSAGADTTFEVCADAPPFPLSASGGELGGTWWPILSDSLFSPQSDPPGTFSYVVGNGLCPADTAFVQVNVWPLPGFSLSQDTAVCSNRFPVLLHASGNVWWQDGSHSAAFSATQPGLYWAEQANAAGCWFRDSVLVSVRPVYGTFESAQPCHGQPYAWNGQTFSSDTTVCVNHLALNGCDSTHCLALSFYYPALALDTSICGNQTLQWLGQAFSSPGLYADTLLLNGCLTATLLELAVMPLDTLVQAATICHGEAFHAGGQTFSASGQYFVTLYSTSSCDTILQLDLSVRPPLQSSTTATVCPGTAYWFNGDSLAAPGVYTAKWSAATTGCDSVVTLFLYQHPEPSPAISGDTVFCNGSGTSLAVGHFPSYQWSNGETTASINALFSGTYTVTVTNAEGCTASTAALVTELPPFLPGWVAGNPACHGESTGFAALTGLSGGVEPLLFRINGAAPTAVPNFQGLSQGHWEILATDAAGCASIFAFDLTDPPELTVDLGPSQELDFGATYPIPVQANQTGAFGFAWHPASGLDCADCPNPVATAAETITYTLVLSDSAGCEASDNLTLFVRKGVGEVYIPNVISPNGDGANDALTVYGNPDFVRAVRLFRVYDRWGELLFETSTMALNDATSGWNGEQKGQPVLPGVFVWYAEILLADGTPIQKSGDVTVVR